MEIRIVHVTLADQGYDMWRKSVEIDLVQYLGFDKCLDTATIHIVEEGMLPVLRRHKDIFLDRGVKDIRKELSRYLLGLKTEKIPVLEGSYRSSRQVLRSLRNLLKKSIERGERRLYIIGVSSEAFESVWAEARIPPAGHMLNGLVRPKTAGEGMPNPEELTPEGVMRLIKQTADIPDSLVDSFAGQSMVIQFIRKMIMCAAQVDYPVLIVGDSGTGKEVVARAIHDNSKRRGSKFQAINCSGIPKDLLESELFGHKRGAFTGAITDKTGFWRDTENGTLFLDEIGDLPLECQAKVLRVLDDGHFCPVGSTKEVKATARIIAATNKDLYSMMKKELFREDLYYRLCCILIRTPALRTIPQDIPIIAQKIWRELAEIDWPPLSQSIVEELKNYQWPGNVRELKLVLRRMCTSFNPNELQPVHVKAAFMLEGQIKEDLIFADTENKAILQSVKTQEHLKRVLETMHAIAAQSLPLEAAGSCDDGAMMETLRLQVKNLEMLCHEPVLFGDGDTFFTVHKLLGELTYMLGGVADLRNYWKKQVKGEIERILTVLTVAVESTRDKA